MPMDARVTAGILRAAHMIIQASREIGPTESADHHYLCDRDLTLKTGSHELSTFSVSHSAGEAF